MCILAVGLFFPAAIPVHADGTLMVSLPTYVAKPILRVGQTFQMNVSMSNSPGVYAWQVNVTFSPSMLQVSEISWGPDWRYPTSILGPGLNALIVNNAGGSLLVAAVVPGAGTPLVQGSDVLFTITWTVMSNKAGTRLHIVTDAENPSRGTTFVFGLPYSTVDGSFCNWNTRQTCS